MYQATSRCTMLQSYLYAPSTMSSFMLQSLHTAFSHIRSNCNLTTSRHEGCLPLRNFRCRFTYWLWCHVPNLLCGTPQNLCKKLVAMSLTCPSHSWRRTLRGPYRMERSEDTVVTCFLVGLSHWRRHCAHLHMLVGLQALAQTDGYLRRLNVIKEAVDDTAGAAQVRAG